MSKNTGKIVLSNRELNHIALAEKVTKVPVMDCIELDGRITFIVDGHLGKAIGRDAKNIKRLEKLMKKEVRFVEHTSDRKSFISNLFKPYRVSDVELSDDIVRVEVNPDDKGKAIGKNGRNINILREIARRHLNVGIKVM